MSHDEEQQRRSRVVVETPTSRREEVYTRTERTPEREGYSTGMVAAVAITAIAATALILFFLFNNSSDATNANVTVAATAPTPITPAPTPLIIQQAAPVQQPPVIIQAPPTTSQPAPVIMSPPPPTSAPASTSTSVTVNNGGADDATLESNVNKAFTDDPDFATRGLAVTVTNGKATLNGSVSTAALKSRAERLARNIKGIRTVDNKITVDSAGLIP